MAIFENAQRSAIHESFRMAARHDRFGELRRGVFALLRGLVVETGRLLRVATIAGVIGAGVGFGLIMLGYSDPVVGLKHFAAAPHCAFADRLGVANARYGQPGYWRHHDTDGNGVACEQ
ncbi:MAG: excalibur calcium-binding domain-containing protein [Hyphomonadaceae bacterium]|nr:excalibur calcium-binding domain-containing protein [Hyphomonadaceae bacterium]